MAENSGCCYTLPILCVLGSVVPKPVESDEVSIVTHDIKPFTNVLICCFCHLY